MGTLAYGAYLAFHATLTVGTLAGFLVLFVAVSNSLLYFTQYARSLLPARAGMQRIRELLNRRPAIPDADDASPIAVLSNSIEFDDVHFEYDGAAVLKSITFRIERGTSVAIVGPSGSGKTTFLSLLIRFYDPSRGTVRIDGRDLRMLAQESWRAQIGLVFQESFLFRGTIRENIGIARPGSTEGVVKQAARDAGLDEFLSRLPSGLNTEARERGDRFSGGERQRIALARALVRNPAVLALDEATSALDPQTEAAVNRTLRAVGRGRTLISITHRLAFVQDFDEILVIHRGRLVELGKHADLLAASGVYAEMWHSQTKSAGTTKP